MHELGHNLNFAHSGDPNANVPDDRWVYHDKTGMMGFSYSSDEGPVMVSETETLYYLQTF